MQIDELVATLRNMRNFAQEEQELCAMDAVLRFVRAASPAVAAERLDAPLLDIYRRRYDEVMSAQTFSGNGGNMKPLAEELPMLTASAAVAILVEDHGMKQTDALKLVADACPSDVTTSNLKDWLMPSRRLTKERQPLRKISMANMRHANLAHADLLGRVRTTFKNTEKMQ